MCLCHLVNNDVCDFCQQVLVKVRLCRYVLISVCVRALLPTQRKHLLFSLRLAYVENRYLRNVSSIAYVLITKEINYICMFNFRILIYFSSISSKHLHLLWCYLDLGSLVLLGIVDVSGMAKKQKKLEISIGFDAHVTMHRVQFLIIKPTRCTNFSNLFLEWNSACFGQFLCPSSGIFHCTHSNRYMSYRYADS
jgi:hypothetical protein